MALSPLQPPAQGPVVSILRQDCIEFHWEDPLSAKLILFASRSVQVLIEFLDFANVLEEQVL